MTKVLSSKKSPELSWIQVILFFILVKVDIESINTAKPKTFKQSQAIPVGKYFLKR